jgi:hypothetical protein
MPVETAQLRVTTPTEPIVPGRGFYQLEEDMLYVQVGLFNMTRRFYSWLESPTVRLELDREGRLIFIEVSRPRRQWPVDENLAPPDRAEIADVRWLDFRRQISEPELQTNRRRSMLRIVFSNRPVASSYYLAHEVILQADERHQPVAIWVCQIEDDLAGHEIGLWRKRCRKLSAG